jgi:hypothetical protein
MTRTFKLTGLALITLIIAGGMGVALGAGKSHVVTTAQLASTADHACAEGTFAWRWNLPGAACDVKSDAN